MVKELDDALTPAGIQAGFLRRATHCRGQAD
jgi:hypothetical protein